jgi:hypothetical protein
VNAPDVETSPLIQFVPSAEISLVKIGDGETLSKSVDGSDINFGEITATKKISYIVMNTGNLEIYDIQFSATNLEIFPSTIGLLDAPKGGLSTTPIVSFTEPHVLPSSGVGSMLEMEVGDFYDTLSVSYNYQLIPFTHSVINDTQIVALMDSVIYSNETADTIWAFGDTLLFNDIEKETVANTLSYSVSGTKMGAVLNLLVSGLPIENYITAVIYQWHSDYDSFILVYDNNFTNASFDSVILTNSGNVSIPFMINNHFSSYPYPIALDTTIAPNAEIDLSGIIARSENPATGNLITFGANSNQPYMFSFGSLTFVDGIMVAEISINE